VNEFKLWKQRQYDAPSPSKIKHAVMQRNGIIDAQWVETGTYKGDTSLFLSQMSQKVFTIEPAEELFLNAKKRFENNVKIDVMHGVSEELMPILLPKLTGDICFWLDGALLHKSPGVCDTERP